MNSLYLFQENFNFWASIHTCDFPSDLTFLFLQYNDLYQWHSCMVLKKRTQSSFLKRLAVRNHHLNCKCRDSIKLHCGETCLYQRTISLFEVCSIKFCLWYLSWGNSLQTSPFSYFHPFFTLCPHLDFSLCESSCWWLGSCLHSFLPSFSICICAIILKCSPTSFHFLFSVSPGSSCCIF
jgi:hypothetical protein